MALYTGTSTDYKDLLADLKTALETEGWTTNKEETIDGEDYKYFQSPNIVVGGSNVNAYINIRTISNATDGYYNWLLYGATAFDGGSSFETQPGQYVPNTTGSGSTLEYQNPTLTLHDTTINYWFVINDRRVIIIADVAGAYCTAYTGLLLPYGTPSEYPLPLYIAGNTGFSRNPDSETTYQMGSFFDPSQYAGRLRLPDGSWKRFNNYSGIGTKSLIDDRGMVWPYCYSLLYQLFPSPDATPTYSIIPAVLINYEEGGNAYGELDGVFWIPGEGANAEDTFNISSEDYLVVINTYRSAREDVGVIKIV